MKIPKICKINIAHNFTVVSILDTLSILIQKSFKLYFKFLFLVRLPCMKIHLAYIISGDVLSESTSFNSNSTILLFKYSRLSSHQHLSETHGYSTTWFLTTRCAPHFIFICTRNLFRSCQNGQK